MHELSVAIRMRDLLEAELRSEGEGLTADSVRVRVGALTNIVPEALEFAWPHAVADSALLGSATIDIVWVDARVRCGDCAVTTTTPELLTLRCPACRSGDVEVIGGDELDIIDVCVRDPAPGPT